MPTDMTCLWICSIFVMLHPTAILLDMLIVLHWPMRAVIFTAFVCRQHSQMGLTGPYHWRAPKTITISASASPPPHFPGVLHLIIRTLV